MRYATCPKGDASARPTAIYKGKETRPINYRLPQLTGERDHPGEDLPAFHFAFEVTPDPPEGISE